MDLPADGREIAKWTAYSSTPISGSAPHVFLALGAEPFDTFVESAWLDADAVDEEGLHYRVFYVLLEGPNTASTNDTATKLELGSYRVKVEYDAGLELILRDTDGINVLEI